MEKSALKKLTFLIIALAVLAVILALPTPGEIDTGQKIIKLTPSGKATLAVLTMAVILWMTESLAFAVTGLLAVVMLVITKAMPFEQLVKDGFGNHIVMFFLGVLILSAAISSTGLLRRLTVWFMFHMGHKPKLIILVVLTVGAACSGWITDMAVAAVLLPIGVRILKDAGLQPLKSNFGKALMISCAWGPLIGGITTPAGCGPNPLTIGFLRDMAGVEFTFIDWMLLGYPAAILMLPAAWLILLKCFPIEDVNLTVAEDDMKSKMREIGPVKKSEIVTIAVFLLTVTLWVSAGWIEKISGGAVSYLSISFVAIACACLLFIPGINVLTWSKAENEISWGGIILIVTGLALGMAIYKTGAAEWLSWIMFSWISSLNPVLIVFVIVFGVSIMKVAFSSNTVTGIIIVPLLIALSQNIGLDARIVAIPAGITASLAFILVTSTPTNVIPYSSGYFSISDMAKAGVWMTIASSISVTVSIAVMGKLFNIVNF